MPLPIVIALAASLSQAPAAEIACSYSSRSDGRPIVRTGPDGIVLTMIRQGGADAVEDACLVEVRDRTGAVVFSKAGFNARLHPDSGRDVDNDGSPDLIIGVDEGGGNRCCWEYSILSFRPMPHVAGGFDNPAFEYDAGGRTVVWSTIAFYDLGPSMAQSPTIAVAEQFRSGKLVEITGEYCDAMLAGRLKRLADLSDDLAALTPPRTAESRRATGKVSFDVEETRVSATTIALQMSYCGREAEARELIRQVWPDRDQESIRAAISVAVASIRRR